MFCTDALCIDQGAHSELSTQVTMMGSMYASAWTVAISLLARDPEWLAAVLDAFIIDNDKDYYYFRASAAYMFAKTEYFNRLWTAPECIT